MSRDVLINFISKNRMIDGYFTIAADTARTLQAGHGMNIISSAIFCRALAGTILLSGSLKNKDDMLSLKWNCSGPVNSIFIEAGENGNARGYIGNNTLVNIEGSIEAGSIKVAPYIELGELTVTRYSSNETGALAPFRSSVILETGEIAEDISAYLKRSLQIESAVNIGLSISRKNEIEVCGGMLLMAMRDAGDEDIKMIYSAFNSITSVTDLLKADNADINSIKNIFRRLDLEIVSTRLVNFNCSCSKDKVLASLQKLTGDGIEGLASKNGKIEADCRYCGTTYSFLPEEIKIV